MLESDYFGEHRILVIVLVLAGRDRPLDLFCLHLIQWPFRFGKCRICQDSLGFFHLFPKVYCLFCLYGIPFRLHCFEMFRTQRLRRRRRLFLSHNHGFFFLINWMWLFLKHTSTIVPRCFRGTQRIRVPIKQIVMIRMLYQICRHFLVLYSCVFQVLAIFYLMTLTLYRNQVLFCRCISDPVQSLVNALSPFCLGVLGLYRVVDQITVLF